MWFGDLVTMRWWNGIWLNEAFATFMSMLAVDAFRPDWEIWNTFTRDRTNAFEIDALETTRPIEYEVRSPDDASGMFDTLTYVKGGAVLRMLEQWLGADRFRDGIRRYLAKHAYGNTETHDLWDALEEETGEPVRRTMDAWIFQAGYPAISVARDGDRVRFTQHRYLPSRDPDDDTTWPVPLMVRQVAGERRAPRPDPDRGGRRRARAARTRCGRGGERGVGELRPRLLRRRAALAGDGQGDGGAVADRALLPGRRRVGRRRRGAGAGRLVPRPRRRGSPTRPTSACGRRSSAGSAGSTGSWTTSRASGCVRSCGTSSGRRSPDSAGTHRGRDRPHPCAPRAARAVPRDPGSRPGDDGPVPRAGARRRRRPPAPPGRRGSRGRGGHRGGPRSLLGALPSGRDAAGGGAVPVRDVAIPRRGRDRPDPRREHDGRGPHPGRPVPPRPIHDEPPPRAEGLALHRGALGPDAGPVRVVQHHRPGLGDPVPHRPEPSSRRSMRSSGTTTSRRTT